MSLFSNNKPFFVAAIMIANSWQFTGCERQTVADIAVESPLKFTAKNYCDAFQKALTFAFEVHVRYANTPENRLQASEAGAKALLDDPQQARQVANDMVAGNCDALYKTADEGAQYTAISVALHAALRWLDPHSGYVARESASAYLDSMAGKSSNHLGLVFRYSKAQLFAMKLQQLAETKTAIADDVESGELLSSINFAPHVKIARVYPTSAAEKAGIQAGDLIHKVDDIEVSSDNHLQIVKLLRQQNQLTLELQRLKSPTVIDKIFNVILSKGPTLNPPVAIIRFDPDTGHLYVRLAHVTHDSGLDVGAAIALRDALQTAFAAKSVKGLIVDVIGNPGGFLNEAVDIVSLFGPAENVVCLKTRTPATTVMKDRGIHDKCFSGSLQAVVPSDIPVVFLVDEATASAGELIPAALLEAQRATLMGSRTFGKGSAYLAFPLTEETLLQGIMLVTTSIYSTGTSSPQATGLTPAIVTDDPKALKAMRLVKKYDSEAIFREEDYGDRVLKAGTTAESAHSSATPFHRNIKVLADDFVQALPTCQWEENDCVNLFAKDWMTKLIAATENGEISWNGKSVEP